MDIQKRKDFLINLTYGVVVIILVYLGIKIGLEWCLPFVLGFAIAMMLQKPIHFISNKLKVKNKIIAIILIALFYIVIGSLASFLVVKVVEMLGDVIRQFPGFYKSTVTPALKTVTNEVANIVAKVNPDGANDFKDFNKQIMSMAMDAVPTISSGSVSFLSKFVSSVPSFLISFLFTIISSFFFAIDYRKIVDFILLQCSPKQRDVIVGIKNHGLGTITKFIKSYGIIMFITFVELSLGLTIIGVDNAIGIALLIAIFDILPVLGTGGIMIPWFLISFINGDVSLGFGLLIIYGIITVIRNIIEPKIVGDQVGAHPVLMLLCMYIGARLLGALGIFILPITLIIIKNLNDEGVIHIYKTKEKDA